MSMLNNGLIQGIISRTVDNTNVQFETLGYVTSNISNYNTTGYKAVRFESYLKENGLIEGKVRIDASSGPIMTTKKDMDVAIDGAGYIPVTRQDGLVAYTRDGSFTFNRDGYLVTSDGFIVGGGIKIPPNYHKLIIKPDGAVSVKKTIDADEEELGKIPLVIFNNPEALEAIENNKVIATNDSGEPIFLKNHEYIKQGKLEKANVSLNSSVDEILRINAVAISSMRVLKAADELYRQSLNLRQG